MEKKKINKEQKKKNNLPLIMALCAVIGTTCSVLALTQDFSFDGMFNKSSSDIIINSENVIDCEYLPATNTSVFQASNGDIQVSTDGHVQVPLFYTSLEKVIPGDYTGNLSFNVDFKSDGFLGFNIPFHKDISNYLDCEDISLYIQNSNNKLRLVAMKGTHHNDNNFELDCFSEDSFIAYSDYVENNGNANIELYWYRNGNLPAFHFKINGKSIKWSNYVEVSTSESGNVFKVDGYDLIFKPSIYVFSKEPIYLDCYDVQATVKNLIVTILE